MQTDDMQLLQKDSYLEGDNLSYIESLYEAYLNNPASVDADWQAYFKAMSADEKKEDVQLTQVRDHFREQAMQSQAAVSETPASGAGYQEVAVAHLINAFRVYGHHLAQLDPLGLSHRHHLPELALENYGLTTADLSKRFQAGEMIGKPGATLKAIYDTLKQTYCGSIGVEYMHIIHTEEVKWLQAQMEPNENKSTLEPQQQITLLERLIAADGLEKYLGLRYVGQKRFSLEGGDSFIPLMDAVIQNSVTYGADEYVIGMAHRGRLNMLVNVLGKAPNDLFAEFEGKLVAKETTGDVKYHKGFSSNINVNGKLVHLSLAFNPSHLEIVSPVVEGSVRARQRRREDHKRDKVLSILVHGDAAIAGQGVVMETFNFSQARGFYTGGAIHIVINNQIGFTTSNPLDARSTLYCTDVAKMVQAPIFHVNADDPEAVCLATKLAIDYRFRFHKDVLIDLVCYRRQGHNEADDPSMTQPIMYNAVKTLRAPWEIYADQLIEQGVLDQQQAKAMYEAYLDKLEQGEEVLDVASVNEGNAFSPDWASHLDKSLAEEVKTSVPEDRLRALGEALTTVPAGFHLHRQVNKLLDLEKKMTTGVTLKSWRMRVWSRMVILSVYPVKTVVAARFLIDMQSCITLM